MITMDPDVDQALARLVSAGTISAEQADAVRREVDTAPERPGNRPQRIGKVLAEIGGYVGAAFVVAAIGVFVGSNWDHLSAPVRMLVFGGPAVLLAAAGLAIRVTAGDAAPARRLAAALLTVAGGLLGGFAYQLLPHDTSRLAGWTWPLLWGVVTLAWAGGYAVVRGGLLHVAALGGLMGTVEAVVDHVTDVPWDARTWAALGVGGSIVAVSAVWAGLVLVGVLRERALGLTVAGVAAFVGTHYLTSAWEYEHSWPGYAATALLAVLGLLGYVRTRVVGLLVVGVVALATVVPEAVIDYTEGALGIAGGLLVAGLSIVAASAVGFRVRREVISLD